MFAQKWKLLRNHECKGESGRDMFMKHQGRRAFWHRHRSQHPQLIEFLVSTWKVTHAELKLLEKNLVCKGGRKGVPPAQTCSWFKDVVEDGDVRPHPGPSGPGRQMQFLWTIAHRPPVVVIQEVCMNAAKQADLANFMLNNGYRSWFACPPTRGGVGVFVRFDKSAHLLRTHCRAEGQAVMLQLDHAILVGTLRPILLRVTLCPLWMNGLVQQVFKPR